MSEKGSSITAILIIFALNCQTETARASTLAEMADASWDLVEATVPWNLI